MKTKSNFYLLLIVLLSVNVSSVFAQDWFEKTEDPNANFYEVQREANEYFKVHGTGRGTLYKQFKRWEEEMKYLIDENGNRINPRTIQNSVAQFESEHNSSRMAQSPTGNWVELGPSSWKRTSGWNPGVGRIDAIAVDPTDNNTIYIGSPDGGVWKSTNGGSAWSSLTDGLTFMKIGAIAIDPSNSNTIYIGTTGAGMLKSTNGGTTLTQINTGYSSTGSVRKIVVDPTNSNTILIGTSGGVYRSTNGGSNWTRSSTVSIYDLELKPGDGNIVYACGTNFYKSTDGGVTFVQITNGILASAYMRIAVTPANPALVCIMQCSGSVFGYLYKSTNSGTSFTTAVTGSSANGTNYMGYSTAGTDNSGQGNYDMALAISPTDANEIHLAGIQTWKSTNGGTSFVCTASWKLPNTLGYCHADVHAIEYVGNTIYTGSDGGIYKSIDKADNFIDLTPGLGIRAVYRMGCSSTDPNVIAIGAQDNGCSIKKSTGWIDWLGADGMESVIDPNNANIIYGATQNGSFYKSTNQGTSQNGLTTPETDGNWITPFAIDKSSAIYVGFIELYKSTDGGTNWTKISNFGGTTNITGFTVAPSNSSYIYLFKGTSISRTSDGGTSWTSIATGLGGATIARVAVHSSSPNKVAVITTNSNVYTSTDGGTTWTSITGNLPAAGGVSIVYDNATTAGLYVGMNSGIYYRDNTMTSWVPFMTNLPKVKVNDLEIQYSVNKIRAATYGRGIWESDLYSITTSTKKEPSFITTLKTFPNPNDGHFNLEMNIAETNNYVIEIYNVLGELVHNESLKGFKGDYNKSFDLSAFGKGVYTLFISNSESKSINKIILY